MTRGARLGLLAALAAPLFAQQPGDDVYPADIRPPAGTQYPCALVALPQGLPGIPEADRAYINRSYARILRATQAKLLVLRALELGPDTAARARYDERTATLLAGLRADAPPPGLEPFREDVVTAIELQRRFFAQALALRQHGRAMSEVYAVPEGRQASARLIAGFAKMQARYPQWSAATRDSIFHHLCALDLF
jgi:hypothetical protein